jgi:NAD(P)-dependent dehydrogenase (short-subunit alcohol dehydrogenase family)
MQQRRVAIVTGASRGIGAATARALGGAGYAVCVNYRVNAGAAAEVVTALEAQGAKARAVQADVALEADVLRLFKECDSTLGSVTALVNNAGIVLPRMRVEQMDAERIARMLATNVTGPFLCCREAIKRMSTRHGGTGGAIVNVSSAASRIGAPGEYVDYAASKGAVDSLTRGLAIEVAAEGIRVNCVRPGPIYTDMHASGGEPGRIERVRKGIPMQRGGTAEEVANAILWLVSDAASYCTGAFLDVAGGR